MKLHKSLNCSRKNYRLYHCNYDYEHLGVTGYYGVVTHCSSKHAVLSQNR